MAVLLEFVWPKKKKKMQKNYIVIFVIIIVVINLTKFNGIINFLVRVVRKNKRKDNIFFLKISIVSYFVRFPFSIKSFSRYKNLYHPLKNSCFVFYRVITLTSQFWNIEWNSLQEFMKSPKNFVKISEVSWNSPKNYVKFF